MSETLEAVSRQLKGAKSVESVVRSMKVVASSNIYRYERAVQAIDAYYDQLKLSIGAYLRENIGGMRVVEEGYEQGSHGITLAVIIGADGGLIGQFNEEVVSYSRQALAAVDPKSLILWTIGEGVLAALTEEKTTVERSFEVPNSVRAITALVTNLLLEGEARLVKGEISRMTLFYNQHAKEKIYEPIGVHVLPLNRQWIKSMVALPWPTAKRPQVIGPPEETLMALIHEYLFVSIYRGMAQSMAAENASRLATVQRADKNIHDLLDDLTRIYQSLRQNAIDEELFDLIGTQ